MKSPKLTKPLTVRLLAGVLSLCAVGAVGAAVAAPGGPDRLADRTEAVLVDLTELRAYVVDAGEPRWLQRLEDVAGRLLLRAAEEPDPIKADAMLDQALKITGVAWSGLAKQTLGVEPVPQMVEPPRFERLLMSTQALADAYQRVGSDRSLVATLPLQIDHILAQYAIGQQGSAEAQMSALYDHIKGRLASELNGVTVVRSLEFVLPEDEYRYEQDRHDAYLMMLRQFFPETLEDPAVAVAVTEAARHHVDAHQQALSGNYSQAIWLLEHSNGELLRVLRAQGLDIPG